MSDLNAAVAKGLSSEICGANPIVNGEEWSCFEAMTNGDEIEASLQNEDGKTYGVRLKIVEVWED